MHLARRARLVLSLLKKEVELCKLQADIREQVEGKIMKEQRRMLLMEQLKSIKKELGLERDDKSALLQRWGEGLGVKLSTQGGVNSAPSYVKVSPAPGSGVETGGRWAGVMLLWRRAWWEGPYQGSSLGV